MPGEPETADATTADWRGENLTSPLQLLTLRTKLDFKFEDCAENTRGVPRLVVRLSWRVLEKSAAERVTAIVSQRRSSRGKVATFRPLVLFVRNENTRGDS